MKDEPTISNNKRRVKANPKYPDLVPTSMSRAININFSSRQESKSTGSTQNQHKQHQNQQQQQLKQYSARKNNKNVSKKAVTNVHQHQQPQHGPSGLTMQFTRTPQQGKHDSNFSTSYTITNIQSSKQKSSQLPPSKSSPPDSSMSALADVNSTANQPFDGPKSLANLAQFSGFELVQPTQSEPNQAKPPQQQQQPSPIARTSISHHPSLPSTSASSSQQSTSSIFGNKLKGNNLMNEHLKTVNLSTARRENKTNTNVNNQARNNIPNLSRAPDSAINMSLSNISSVQLLNQTSDQDFAIDYKHFPGALTPNSSSVGSVSMSQPVSPPSLNRSQQSTSTNNNQCNPKSTLYNVSTMLSKSRVTNSNNNNTDKPRVIKKKQQKQNNDLYQQFATDNNTYMSHNFIQSQGEMSQASTSSQYNNPYLNLDINNINNDNINYQDDDCFVKDAQDELTNYNSAGGEGGCVGYEDDNENDNDNQLNNATLLKLMSILSNPALTITPIDNSTTQRSDEPNGQSSDYNLNEDNINNNNRSNANTNRNDLTFSMPPIEQLDENVHAIIIGDESNDRNVDISKIVIKSSTNSNDLNDLSNNVNEFDGQQSYLHSIKLGPNQNNKNSQNSLQNGLLGPIVTLLEEGNLRATNQERNNQQEPLTISTSVRNLILQQSDQQQLDQPKESRLPPTISVELLKQTMMEPCSMASADAENDNDANDPHLRSIYGQDCASRIPLNMRKLPKPVRVVEKIRSVAVSPPPAPKKTPRKQFKPCARRLMQYDKNSESQLDSEDRVQDSRQTLNQSHEELLSTLANIKVVEIGERNVYLSERHEMIDSMISSDEGEDGSASALAIVEPDEIFINRPKKIMSSIDTMIERKKRRRFERISGREAPKTTSYEEQFEDSDAEWDDEGDLVQVDQINFFKTQLPLEEPENKTKNYHLKSLGLVSRKEKNKILLDRSEMKYSRLASMLIEPKPEVAKQMSKFSSEVLRTQGFNPPPWTVVNGSLKRSDLALLEGLNRNSSRIKVAYMNSLGLEKKSKRISLYKMKPMTGDESTCAKQQKHSHNNYYVDPKRKRDQNDDNDRVHKKTNRNLSSSISHELVVGNKNSKQSSHSGINDIKSSSQSDANKQNNGAIRTQLYSNSGLLASYGINNVRNKPNGIVLGRWEDSVDLIASPTENGNSNVARPFCRDLMEPQSKDDYMKSLGLMAS